MKSPIVAIAVLALVAGCSPPGEKAAQPANDADAVNVAAPAPQPSKSPDQSFVDTVAALNAYAAGAGTLAEQKGSTAAVRAFGKKLMLNRVESTMRLKLAAAKQPDLLIDASLDEEQNANIRTLQDASGPAFDAAFKGQMVVALTRLEALVKDRYIAINSGDPALRGFASITAPTVRANLAAAKAL